MNSLETAQRLTSVFSGRSADSITYTPLKGGLSQATLYHFEVEKRSYVLRLFPQVASAPLRLHQALLAKQAGKIGVGPQVLFVDSQGIIMDYIQASPVQVKDFENPRVLADFSLFLKKLHFSKELFPPTLSAFQRFHRFAGKKEKQFPPDWPHVVSLMKEFEKQFQARSPFFVPTHLDLSPGNILYREGQFFLVDWVNGGLNDPYFDLATFVIFNGLTDSQTQFFLTHYFNRDLTFSENRYFWMGGIARLFVVAAAFLSVQIACKDSLPSFSDYLRETQEKQPQRPLHEIGLILYRHGLELTRNHL